MLSKPSTPLPYQDDPVINPKHHKGVIGDLEYTEVCEAFLTPEQYEGHLISHYMKYLLRAGKKDPVVQDLKKALWYIEKRISYLERMEAGQVLEVHKSYSNSKEE